MGLDGGTEHLAHRVLGAVQVVPALFGPGDVVDVLDQPGEPAQSIAHEPTGVLVPVRGPVLEGFPAGVQHRSRGARPVGRVRVRPPAGITGVLQAGGHGAEGGGHRVRLGTGAHGRDPDVVALADHPAGRLGECGQGPLDGPARP